MRKFWFILFLGLVLIALVTACGGGDSGGGAAEEPAQEEVPGLEAGDPVAGQPKFEGTCGACHGMDAKGMPNLGKDLTTSEFLHDQGDAEILAFLKIGRPAGDPLNTTGVDMPPKGGNPALTDQDLMNIIAYLRSLKE